MAPVIIIESIGVWNFLLILLIPLGNKLSLLNAKGYRDAAIIPAFAVVIKANREAIEIIINPEEPITIFAESATGVKEVLSLEGSNVPMTIISINTYKIVTTVIEVIIPKGKFFLGFLTSSAILATFSSPPKEIKIKPAVVNMEPMFLVINGLNRLKLILGIPKIIYITINESNPATNKI